MNKLSELIFCISVYRTVLLRSGLGHIKTATSPSYKCSPPIFFSHKFPFTSHKMSIFTSDEFPFYFDMCLLSFLKVRFSFVIMASFPSHKYPPSPLKSAPIQI